MLNPIIGREYHMHHRQRNSEVIDGTITYSSRIYVYRVIVLEISKDTLVCRVRITGLPPLEHKEKFEPQYKIGNSILIASSILKTIPRIGGMPFVSALPDI
jgi:hypothetical protein